MRAALLAGGWKFTPIETRTEHSGSLTERFIKDFSTEGAAILDVEELLKEDVIMCTGSEGEDIFEFTFLNGQKKRFQRESGWELLKYLYKHVPKNGRAAVHELNKLMDCSQAAPH